MIITIKGADFSNSNVGTLSTYFISRNIDSGVTHNIPTSISKNASANWQIILSSGYEYVSYSFMMGSEEIIPTVSEDGKTLTIVIPEVTANVYVNVSVKVVGSSSTITDLSSFETQPGFINSNNTWNNITGDKYRFVLVPIIGATSLTVTADPEQALYMAGLKTFSTPVMDAIPDFSSDSTWSKRITVGAGTTKTYASLPADIKYLVFFVVYSSKECYPSSITINQI